MALVLTIWSAFRTTARLPLARSFDYDLNVAHTLETQLNVFADFKPNLSEESKAARLVFLEISNRIFNAKCENRFLMPNSLPSIQ